MYSLFKKEIIQFFGSIIGTLVSTVFLLVTGLFLWVFSGNYNIPEGGYASLNSLFSIAPWIYLLLVPAVTMRMFADEKRSGTMELLLTRPVSSIELILAKFFAALTVVLLTLVPTLTYFFSVYFLGNPVGCIDIGATWGSYLGLLFLAVIYLTIGLFTSAYTDNQIVAFIIAVFLCFFWYSGFELIADLPFPSSVALVLTNLGINSHYESVSRGVLDSRDLLYFLFMAGFFILLTRIVLEWKRLPLKRPLQHLGAYLIISFVVTWISGNSFFRVDFTAERRYTLSDQSIKIIERISSPLEAEILLAGDLPPGLIKLQQAVSEKLKDIKVYCGRPLNIFTTDPYEVIPPGINKQKYVDNLIAAGIVPVNLRINTDRGITTKTVFPTLVLRTGNDEVIVNLLKNDPTLRDEVNLNHSVELLEYEIIRGIKMLFQGKKETVAFLTGHDEADELQLKDFESSIYEGFNIQHITSEMLLQQPDSFKALMIANPLKPFTEKDKFSIDQYIMRGGRVMWIVDPVHVSLDSLSGGMSTMAFPGNLNIDDQLFRYGIRINHDLIQDVDCQQLKVNTAMVGQPPKYALAPWYFSPLLSPVQDHPIGKNVSRILSEFVSSIDIVNAGDSVKRTVIISSSAFSRTNQSPLIVTLRMIDAPPTRNLFNKQFIATGVLAEGSFTSLYKNRMISQMGLTNSYKVQSKSKMTKIIVISDGGMIVNKVAYLNGKFTPQPLGYDKVSNITFGNKEFLVNALHYLCDDSGLMDLRSRTVQMRLLNKVILRESKQQWGILNVTLPVIIVLLGGLLFSWRRNFKQSKPRKGNSET